MAFTLHLNPWQGIKSAQYKVRAFLADKPDGKEQVWHMLSYFLRELAVLLVAFYPLEQQYFRTKAGFLEVCALAAICLIVGIVIERRR